ncbi:hypothetical protein SAMN05216412_1151, partial [Nitrosospira multiformis]
MRAMRVSASQSLKRFVVRYDAVVEDDFALAVPDD